MKTIIYFEVLNTIFQHANSFSSKEVGGFLFGLIKNNKLFIKRAYRGKKSGSSIHIEISKFEMIKAIEEMNIKHPNLKLIGWYHSHPGMGAHFFSQTDINTQLNYQVFFPEAKALVIDTKKKAIKPILIPFDLQAWRVKNNKAEKVEFFLENSFKKKKHNFENNIKLIGNKFDFLKRIEEFVHKEISYKVEMNLTSSKYHINFQENPRKIFMKIFTQKYKDFDLFDCLLYGTFSINDSKQIMKLAKLFKLNLKSYSDRRQGKKILLLKNISELRINDFLEILKKISKFWK
ncbi:MAG: hypothetical protein EAX96_09605 [Candidatus Lokiarchaeota archaeon]|nr:hypothetical protein [Candidatus Lokiarchaeota archaeon]